jgi:hypothetical protein
MNRSFFISFPIVPKQSSGGQKEVLIDVERPSILSACLGEMNCFASVEGTLCFALCFRDFDDPMNQPIGL